MDILKKASKYNIHIKITIITLLVLSTIGVVLYVQALSNSGFYDYLDNGSYRARSIDTPFKLWFYGYFGIFFRVNEFGYLILLLLPCYFYIILGWENISRAAKALFFVFSISAILIGIKGFANFRYAFTLFPFVILIIFWLSYDFSNSIKDKLQRKGTSRWIFYTILIFLIIGFLSIYSVGIRKNGYVRYWKYGNSASGDSMDFIHSLNKLNISDERKILVVNINAWFYHTNFDGVMYKSLGVQDNSKALWDRIQKENIKYILVENYIFRFPKYQTLVKILKDNSKARLLGKGGYLLLYVVRRQGDGSPASIKE